MKRIFIAIALIYIQVFPVFAQNIVCFDTPDGNVPYGWSYKDYLIPPGYKIDSVYMDAIRPGYPASSHDFIFEFCPGDTAYHSLNVTYPFSYDTISTSMYKIWIDLKNYNIQSIGMVRILLPTNAGTSWNNLCFAISPATLVCYLPFNGNANDESGNGNNGTVNGAIFTTDRFGYSNSAYLFDGTSSNITVQPFFNIGNEDYSISMWININDTTQVLQTFFNTLPHSGIGINYNADGVNIINYFLGDGNEGYWSYPHLTGNHLNYLGNIWYHIVLIKNGINYSMYVNNSLDYSFSADSSFNAFNLVCGLYIGSICMNYEYFNGKIDDIRLYYDALTQNEITLLYHEGGWANAAIINTVLTDQMICKNDSISFKVIAGGIPPISYQWQKNGADVPGASDSILIIPEAQPEDTGEYRCIATNDYGTDTSNTALLTVEFAVPTIIQGFINVYEYQVATYSVEIQQGHTYEFIVEGGNRIDGTENSITVHWGVAGQGYVKLVETSDIGCDADTNTMNVTIGSLGIDDQETKNLLVYPNPFSGKTTFS